MSAAPRLAPFKHSFTAEFLCDAARGRYSLATMEASSRTEIGLNGLDTVNDILLRAPLSGRPRVDGKFLDIEGTRLLVKGVTYGTFAPDTGGGQFPPAERVASDFAAMAEAGINTVRLYTAPQPALLDEAARHGLRVMIGLPWSQHVAFLDDRRLTRKIRREAAAQVRALGNHPASFLFNVGNEIPASVVRWHGRARVERFLRDLYDEAKAASPHSLLTYVNFPPTEYLDVDCYDVCSFNVYLHREPELRGYLARLQQIAGIKPLLLAEAGADSIREGPEGQAQITAMHVRAAFEEGLCGAIAFAWTDDWWRGGSDVSDWAFGLVDHERRPKPALAAVTQAFADAPFSASTRRAWPSISVVVCAYNAADTLHDCLSSLQRLTYPDFEVIVVNDGSRDTTSEIAHSYPGMRVIDIPNGGLSAARNVGLAAARGEIVAYTDADVRVDPEWLSHLAQPFVNSDVAGSGGPNVVPLDDPWVAQCVARSPGGPTQVLFTDRIAEHVPGCNMAFRREALLAIGGFNPVYLRAGDDVDVCWRLQAKGQAIGFAPSALVWHHHRPSVKAYWRQQVGYGEGETWLDAHHPEKFVRGNMIWRGRIYSPLPFVRSLSGRRINTGVWGTAAFPSVYRTDVNALQFLPHSPLWLALASLASLAGVAAMLSPFTGAAVLLLAAGLLGWGITIGRCLRFGLRSDLSALRIRTSWLGRVRCRLLIAVLHFIQPLARFHGRVRGMMSPPLVVEPERVTRFPWKAPVFAVRDSASASMLLAGGWTEETYWGETWTSQESLLTEITGLLRAVRPPRYVEVDDGWHPERDVSVALGRWGWLDLRAFIEEHGGPKVLLRVTTRLRPGLRGIMLAVTLTTLSVVTASAAIALRWPWLSAAFIATAGFALARALWQAATAVAVVRHAMLRATSGCGMIPIPVRSTTDATRRLRPRPATLTQAIQGLVTVALVTSVATTAVSLANDLVATTMVLPAVAAAPEPLQPTPEIRRALAVAPNGDLFLADADDGVIRRFDTRPFDRPFHAAETHVFLSDIEPGDADLAFASPADVAVAPNGDLYVADAENHRICRIERVSGRIITVAGYGLGGFDSDDVQATQTALNRPQAVAVAGNGDLYIADTLNHRVRVITQATGVIRTVAGNGQPGGGDWIGDGGLATDAHLNRPTDVALAPNGDIYIADMGHNRVRVVDAKTGVITTVAGDGQPDGRGDGGAAAAASLGGPSSLALVAKGRRLTLFIGEYVSGSVRVVDANGVISTLGEPGRFIAPTRLAYRSGGWLYVASENGVVTAVNVAKGQPYQIATMIRPRRHTS
jgi:GT2 family glycosyltransferase